MTAALLLLAGTVAGQQPCPHPRYVPAIIEREPANFYMNLYGSPRPQPQIIQQFDNRPDLLPLLRYMSDQNQQILMLLLTQRAERGPQLYAVPGQMPAPPCGDGGPQMERRLSPEQLPTQPPQYQPPGQLPYPRPCQPGATPYATPGYDGYVQPGPAVRLQPPVGYQRYTVR